MNERTNAYGAFEQNWGTWRTSYASAILPKIPHAGLELNMGLHGKELVTNCMALAKLLTML
jgi:hypothetical protein